MAFSLLNWRYAVDIDATKVDYEDVLSEVARGLKPNAIRKLTPLLARPEIISLAPGAPSPDVFPKEELAEIASSLIRDRWFSALQYGPTRGNGDLVQELVEYLHLRGFANIKPANILVTTGSQQGLDLATRVLLDRGDVVLVELPSYIGGLVALHNCGASLIGVRQDDGGIIIDDLREKVNHYRRLGRRVKCIYTIPNFQNPSGVTLAAERRHQIMEVAREHNLIVIEDDPYRDIYFSEDAGSLTPLAAIDPSRVIYINSFSKILAPGLRVAWLVAPEPIAARIELAKEGADLSSSQLDMAIVCQAMRSGLLGRHVPTLRRFYREHRDIMIGAMKQNMPAGSAWTTPDGGFFVFYKAPDGLDAAALLPNAIEAGVAYVPGDAFFVDGSGKNTMRLAFCRETPEKITEGIRRLGEVLRKNLA
jgi:2-aminoadipate transaminase